MDWPAIRKWIGGMGPEDFDTIEFHRRRYFREKLTRVHEDEPDREVNIVCCTPGLQDIIDARTDTRALMKDQGLKPDEDKDLFETLNDVALTTYCVREERGEAIVKTGHYPRLHTLEDALNPAVTGIDLVVWDFLWRKIQAFQKAVPAPPIPLDQLNGDEIVEVAMAIAAKRNLTPLVAIAGSDVDIYVVRMAEILSSYHLLSSSSPSGETSTPER